MRGAWRALPRRRVLRYFYSAHHLLLSGMARAKRGKRRIVVAVLPEIRDIGAKERRTIVRELRSGKRKSAVPLFRLKDVRQFPNK
jgi:hypothetical protein